MPWSKMTSLELDDDEKLDLQLPAAIAEMPEYLHDALAIGLEHDDFYVDSEKYTNEETEYLPKWRNSSQLAPSEVVIIKDQNLKNSSC